MGANFTDISAGQDGENIGFATLMKQGADLMMNSEQEDGVMGPDAQKRKSYEEERRNRLLGRSKELQ